MMVGGLGVAKETIGNMFILKSQEKFTVRGKLSENLDQFLLNSIWKQAGWK